MEGTEQGYQPDTNQPENPSVDPVYPPSTSQGQTQPPQQGVYPPGTGYPPNYQPQQEGYPLSYPTPTQGYHPDQNKDVPPPYHLLPPQQGTTTGVVVVQQQPTYTTITNVPVGDHYRTFSIIVCILCCIFGSPLTLCCSLPALYTALQARDAERHGNTAYAADKDRITITLNIIAIVFGFIILVLNIVRLFVIGA